MAVGGCGGVGDVGAEGAVGWAGGLAGVSAAGGDGVWAWAKASGISFIAKISLKGSEPDADYFQAPNGRGL
ncbi:hypothetical protein D1O30_13255 [Methylocystis hirsuta]|uniref:Uncharacterized protein n=1 Tax=Methylocystis hirsuta TaxID=369798 RepID=A0A3M9XRE4_9HYPH|nr:hypothetical protein D1O30_13255 [Methylocystis hirsuta]